VNEKFCAISKFSARSSWVRIPIINSGHHPKAFMEHLWNTILAGHVWKGEIKNRAKDGTYYWVDTTIVPFLGDDDRPHQFVAIRADITQRKESEEALRPIPETRKPGNPVRRIAHDFTTLLTTILGNTNLGAMHLPPESPAMPYLHHIEQATFGLPI